MLAAQGLDEVAEWNSRIVGPLVEPDVRRTDPPLSAGLVVSAEHLGAAIEEVAASAGTISYELSCVLTRRVRFEYT